MECQNGILQKKKIYTKIVQRINTREGNEGGSLRDDGRIHCMSMCFRLGLPRFAADAGLLEACKDRFELVVLGPLSARRVSRLRASERMKYLMVFPRTLRNSI